MDNRVFTVVLALLGGLCVASLLAWVGFQRAEAVRAMEEAQRAAIAHEHAALEAEKRARLEAVGPEAVGPEPVGPEPVALEPREERRPVPALESAELATAEARVAELGRLVDELLVAVEGDGQDAAMARAGLDQAYAKLLTWKREQAEARRKLAQEQRSEGQGATSRAKVWIDDASQLDDPALRNQAIAAIRAALLSEDPLEQLAALKALAALGQVRFDKQSFRQPILSILEEAEGSMLVSALYALANTERRPEDLALALRAIDDPVARESASHLVFLFAEGDATGETGNALLRLFESNDPDALRGAMQGLWGARVSPEIAARVLELTDSSDHELRHNAIYFGLSTWQNKSPSVVAKLIEVLGDRDHNNYGRALWGLGHGVPEESWPAVTEAMRKYHEARSDVHSQTSALRLIGMYGTVQESSWLQALRDNPDAPEAVREAAGTALLRLQGR